MGSEPSANETACHFAGDEVIGTVVAVIEAGIRDGSMRKDIGDPLMLALSLWAFTHGITNWSWPRARISRDTESRYPISAIMRSSC